MSYHLEAERDRLLAEINAIRSTGDVASAGTWIDSYIAKNKTGKGYKYYKLVADRPIFTGRNGGKTKTLHLGKADHQYAVADSENRYCQAVLSIKRRNAIQQLETQSARVEQLINLATTLPSATDFQVFALSEE